MTVVQRPDEGEVLDIGPTRTIVKVPGEATGGRLGVVEMRLSANWEGPPPHVHERVEHVWYVISGEVVAHLDDRIDRYGAGSCIYVPARTPHTFSTAGCPESILLEVDTPRALDGYFRDLLEAFPAGQPVNPTVVGEIMSRHDTQPYSGE